MEPVEIPLLSRNDVRPLLSVCMEPVEIPLLSRNDVRPLLSVCMEPVEIPLLSRNDVRPEGWSSVAFGSRGSRVYPAAVLIYGLCHATLPY
jgi:hypothetical protein